MLTTDEEHAYDLWTDGLDHEAYSSCVNHLTCNLSPGGSCDIDDSVGGNQSCAVASAKGLCATHVLGILSDQLKRPSPSKYP